ncbi:MAG: hypothetical protein HFF60_10915 [Oscillospiraceae bacterium]|nr:hypothetical protein [Oscillospiraceae bacterium]
MSERYSKLFALSENLYSAGAPVVIAAGALQKDNQTGKVFAQLKMRNIQDKAVKAATVKISPFDTVGKPLGGTVDYQYLDLSAGRDTDFGQKTPVMLKEAATRSFAVSVSEVIFSDNSIWTAPNEVWEPLSPPVALETALSDNELAKQYRVKYGADCKCVFKKEKDLWRCACGAINHASEKNCHSCQREAASLAALNVDELKADRDHRVAAEQKATAEKKAAAAEQAKKTKKIVMITIPIAVVAIVAVVIISGNMQKSTAYNAAVALAEAGQYDEAIAAFAELGDYKDSIEWANQNVAYEKAIYLLDCAERGDDAGLKVSTQTKPKTDATPNTASPGSVEQEIPDTIPAKCAQKAITVLKAIGDYRDSMVLIERANTIIEIEIEAEKEGYYVQALEALKNKDYDSACELFAMLGNYKDSAAKLTETITESNYQQAVSFMSQGKYSSAFEMLSEIKDYKDSAERFAECTVKGAPFDYLREHKDGFKLLTGEEITTAFTGTWNVSDYDYKTFTFLDNGTIETGKFWNGKLVSRDWSIQGDTITIGSNSGITVREVYDGGLILYNEAGKVYMRMWK